MKKTFVLSHPKIKLPRLVEAIKFEVKKYLRRERKKSLPEGADYWDFDCRFGADKDSAQVIHLGSINKHIDEAEKNELASFYLEILAKPGVKKLTE
ncbi:MAG: hypothetical protein CL579_01320 [Alteromonadaceae bacterium]|jgi:hypothetical protein|uniref:Orphan protein n=1 Tax=Paraglaciecola mesophila KMM 241 TaxID=1128912 RepID=K6XYM7_9ALTE|nr:DUF6172 family protein [Paraglaciecola mesophila]MAD14715.1 hypothetical protein [Alteromonadaceae bacterium]MBB20035.1 hypothetical protein [Rickettsiales bacterium]GAC25694.1 hypothetical protein GMES_3417 [Paraglaciecola mesophila KMM 241]|tara:strand:- start:2359 stop:2646 length:288 start_codon:yes stop_codon:yes gene_type:complete